MLVLAAAAGGPASADAKSLHWPSLEVALRIDEEGLVHITERHTMLFDGDWNGGERRFQRRSWQEVHLESVSELIPASAERVELQEGDLDAVNEYRLEGNTLRWRSRLPSDAPFRSEIKRYEIVYTISGALIAEDQSNAYRLNHDLAFPDRDGMIEKFTATLELAPAWDATDLPQRIERENLAPGQSVFVTASVTYVGAGTPSAAARLPEQPSTTSLPALRYALTVLAVIVTLLLFFEWLRSERSRGRLEPTLSPDEIDEAWLANNIFRMKPELVGAAWDRDTSTAEVAALIARLVQEGKLSSTVTRQGWGPFKRDNLHLTLQQPRDRFESYEARLIAGLFINDATSIDTDTLRAHYKTSGFNPSGLIEAPIARKLPAVFKTRSPIPGWRKWTTAMLLLTGAALTAIGWVRAPDESFPTVLLLAPLAVVYVIGIILAFGYHGSTHDLRARAVRALIAPLLIVIGLSWVQLGGIVPLTSLQLLGLTVLVLGALNSLFNAMHGRDTPEGLELRRKLGSARKYFERELASERPRLRDEWFPYLLAFGLGPRIERWFKSFGSNAQTGVAFTTTPNSSSGTSSGTSGWTGGGGTFGGAGASASWTSAVAGVAAGVAKPSSSGGSSGGGGGGSSSGGGGGGGW
jgi:hypothetical protein